MGDLFDLNIEKVLEHWEVKHALREIIANAIDEQFLTGTEDVQIYEKNGSWIIRDFGRGIQSTHFTQNENEEKLQSTNLIGKFGVGLKDALAVLYRNNIEVTINSKYAHITTRMAEKAGFDIPTLHAVFTSPADKQMQGTEFVIKGVSEHDIEEAKAMFLRFAKYNIPLEETRYGEVYQKSGENANIYINGVLVATEDNFLFSYNITNISAQIKKALNRERSNVGRTAYTSSIKSILTNCKNVDVVRTLVKDVENLIRGTNKDESGWVDVAAYAVRILDKTNQYVFMTPSRRSGLTNQQVEVLQESGKTLIQLPDNIFNKVHDSINTFDDVFKQYEAAYQYKFIPYNQLTAQEKEIFDKGKLVLDFFKRRMDKNGMVNAPIKISETIRMDASGRATKGCYDSKENVVIIKRDVLHSTADFFGVLAHELVHCVSGAEDNTRDFENVLTDVIGYLFDELKDNRNDKPKRKGLWGSVFKR